MEGSEPNKSLVDGVITVEGTDGYQDKEYDAYVSIAVADDKRQEVMEYLKTVPEVQEATALEEPVILDEDDDKPIKYNMFATFASDSREQLHKAIYERLNNDAIIHTVTNEPIGVDWGHWERDEA